jgi:hypothetical protein
MLITCYNNENPKKHIFSHRQKNGESASVFGLCGIFYNHFKNASQNIILIKVICSQSVGETNEETAGDST